MRGRRLLARLICLLLLLSSGCTVRKSDAPPASQGAQPGGTTPAGQPAPPPPAVANAGQARQYAGVTLVFYGESIGLGAQLDAQLAGQFSSQTGIEVRVVQKPADTSEAYHAYQRLFQQQSSQPDVLMLDVIWPAAFAEHLLDLGPQLGELASKHYPAAIESNTVGGRLVALPWFGDFGMLYYRTDLLARYGYAAPPQSWDELEQMAQTIQVGERDAGNSNFTGFVWQGAPYEGLTCVALEWIYSHGGGSLIEDGRVTLNNAQASRALDRARGWIGTISPLGVTNYKEEDVRTIFQGGNAAFMRNWPYAAAVASAPDSPVRGKFDVAPLPHEPGQQSVGVLGGWSLAVSRYSQHPEAAIEFLRYLTSPEVQTYRAISGSYVPTISAVSQDSRVVEAMPFLAKLADLRRLARPSRELGAEYADLSTAFYQGVSQILQGQDATKVLPRIEQRLQELLP